MKKHVIIMFSSILLIGFLMNQSAFAQLPTECYKVSSRDSKSILIENGQLYRITIKSCWYSASARIGTYLIYGLNVSDPKTNGQPSILTIAESPSTDWTFSFSLSGSYNANMMITSNGWGDQGLLIIVEKLTCN